MCHLVVLCEEPVGMALAFYSYTGINKPPSAINRTSKNLNHPYLNIIYFRLMTLLLLAKALTMMAFSQFLFTMVINQTVTRATTNSLADPPVNRLFTTCTQLQPEQLLSVLHNTHQPLLYNNTLVQYSPLVTHHKPTSPL